LQNVTLTLRGRDAIPLAIKHFELKEQNTVLLPAYLCKIIVVPFANGFDLQYYDIEKDFSINTEVIESMLRSYDVKVLYVIHYFGFLHKNLEQISKLCKEHGVLLWEDHAHSALSRFSYDYADVMIFSFRKIFPVPDGGGIWFANTQSMKISGGVLASNIISMLIHIRRSKWAMGKKLRNKAGQIASLSTASTREGFKHINPRPISYMSRHILRCVDVENAFAIRRDIFMKWQHLLSDSEFKPVFSMLPENVCPQGFPIYIQNAEEVIGKLRGFNVFLKVHWPLDAEMKEKCPEAYNVSRSIITLPIYPGLSQSDMERIASLLERYGRPIKTQMN
jgi:dTDP-4-amino-4,6-dideoxygalactose transaminase